MSCRYWEKECFGLRELKSQDLGEKKKKKKSDMVKMRAKKAKHN